ncbi:MAG: lipid-A-disaccharide synthase [Candidatus Calescibacterium sp.]|jgi:lipid-A-disaccharide synthase
MKFFISCADFSAELYITRVSPFLGGEIFSTSPKIKNSKCIIDLTKMSIIGIPSFKNLTKIFLYFINIVRFIIEQKIDLLILCDAPDFNIPLGSIIKAIAQNKIKIVYFIPPTVWAWRESRKTLVEGFSDKVLYIFPFEKSIWRKNGIFIGHPLCKIIRDEEKIFQRNKPEFITILPGSRISEIKRHQDIVIELSDIFYKEGEKVIIPTNFPELFSKKSNLILIPSEDSRWAMRNSKFIITSSGTASLESALLGKPAVVFYKIDSFSFEIAKRIVNIRFISLPNIILNNTIYPELIQNDATPERIYSEVKRIKDRKFDMIRQKLFSELEGLEFKEIAEIIRE